MAPFPLDLASLLGKPGMYAVFLAIGFAFGYVLESSGFNHAPTLAAQFYFRDMRVLKVFFTAIVTAMLLIFAAAGLGLLDYNAIWVNPTYLWSGILGGLIMGAGFILGGFCPGTSLVALATFKLDGVFFVLGGLFGVFLFSETVQSFADFFYGSYYGRLTLMDVFHLPAGVVALLVTLLALFMFWGGEKLEQKFGGKPASQGALRRVGAGVAVLSALALVFIGQPTPAQKWARLAPEKQTLLDQRQVQIHPGELLASLENDRLVVRMIDVRSEADYNLFHLRGAEHIPLEDVPAAASSLLMDAGDNVLFVLMSNDEAAATEAWKVLVAESVPNVYILEGGINEWLDYFANLDEGIQPLVSAPQDALRYAFPAALGDHYNAADVNPHAVELEYTPKIKLEGKRGPSGGGCG